MKTCLKCKQNKHLPEFYKNQSKGDGFQDYCKLCDKIRLREYLKTAKGKAVSLKGAKKYQKSAKGRATKRLYKQSEKSRAAQKLFREHHQNYIKAVRAVNSAVRYGKMPHPSTYKCHYCPKQAEQYHHWHGYEPEHWLDVVPTCRECHIGIHWKVA